MSTKDHLKELINRCIKLIENDLALMERRIVTEGLTFNDTRTLTDYTKTLAALDKLDDKGELDDLQSLSIEELRERAQKVINK